MRERSYFSFLNSFVALLIKFYVILLLILINYILFFFKCLHVLSKVEVLVFHFYFYLCFHFHFYLYFNFYFCLYFHLVKHLGNVFLYIDLYGVHFSTIVCIKKFAVLKKFFKVKKVI